MSLNAVAHELVCAARREKMSRLIAWLSPHHFACPEQSIGASFSGKTNGVVAAHVMRKLWSFQ